MQALSKVSTFLKPLRLPRSIHLKLAEDLNIFYLFEELPRKPESREYVFSIGFLNSLIIPQKTKTLREFFQALSPNVQKEVLRIRPKLETFYNELTKETPLKSTSLDECIDVIRGITIPGSNNIILKAKDVVARTRAADIPRPKFDFTSITGRSKSIPAPLPSEVPMSLGALFSEKFQRPLTIDTSSFSRIITSKPQNIEVVSPNATIPIEVIPQKSEGLIRTAETVLDELKGATRKAKFPPKAPIAAEETHIPVKKIPAGGVLNRIEIENKLNAFNFDLLILNQRLNREVLTAEEVKEGAYIFWNNLTAGLSEGEREILHQNLSEPMVARMSQFGISDLLPREVLSRFSHIATTTKTPNTHSSAAITARRKVNRRSNGESHSRRHSGI
jgi:hypothetical protein